MNPNYPPTGFHFMVSFDGLSDSPKDFSFQSVSGLSVEMEYEEVKEGGVNQYVHQLPVRSKFSELVLKRGMVKGSKLVEWMNAAMNGFQFFPINMQVVLLNENHEPLQVWKVVHVLPKKLEFTAFDAEKSELVIETLTLSYNFYKTLS
jgi:phage tail-like protein